MPLIVCKLRAFQKKGSIIYGKIKKILLISNVIYNFAVRLTLWKLLLLAILQ